MRENVPDSDQRVQAVSDTEHNIVLVAGAGTGKTTILVDRILELVIGRGIGLDEIVALTFTDKAAAEMKLRLGREMERYLRNLRDGGVDSQDLEFKEKFNEIRARNQLSAEQIFDRLQRARVILEQAQIGTIHSFAAHILRLHPLEIGVSPGFQVDDGTILDEFFARKWEDWMLGELILGSPREEKWRKLLGLVGLEELQKMAKRLSDFEVSTGLLKSAGSEEKKYLSELRSFEKELQSFIAALSSYRKVKRISSLEKLLEIVQKKISGVNDAEFELEDLMRMGSLPKPGKDWNQVDIQMSESLYRRGKTLVQVDPGLFQLVSEVILPFVEKFRDDYLAEGYISFSGLLFLARELLLENHDVRQELKKRFRAVLVDEFQDTDPIQYDMVLLLSEALDSRAKNLSELELEPGKIFIVGDPKQSIYTFRRADIEAYETVLSRIFSHRGIQLELSTNFRSHSELIDFINYSCNGDDRSEGLIRRIPGFQPEYRPIRPYRKKSLENQKVEIVLVDNPGKKLKAEDAREGEAEAIVRWIRSSVGKGMIESETGEERPLRYSDIALLLRSLNPARTYLEVFKANRIPYVIEGEKYFYSTQEILDFYNLVRSIADPHDRIALVGVLRSPLGGLSDPEIFSLAAMEHLDYTRPVDSGFPKAGRVNSLYKSLRRLHEMAGHLPLPDLLDRIFSETYIREICAAGLQGEQKLANLDKIRSQAVSAAGAGGEVSGIGLVDFVRQIEKYHRELEEEGESPLADETVDAVRILSVHKAKGLEFPVVILSDLHRQDPRGRETPVLLIDRMGKQVGLNLRNVKSLSAVELMEKEENRRAEEENRVLYVAMTRARERLIMTGSIQFQEHTYAQKIERALGLAFSDLGPGIVHLPANALFHYRVVKHDPSRYRPRVSARTPRAGARDMDTIARFWEKQEELWKQVWRSPRFLTPTGEEYPLVSSAPGSGREEEDTGPTAPSGLPAQVGIVCHRVLEEWDFLGGPVSTDKLDRAIGRSIKATLAEGNADPGLAREVKKILGGFFQSEIFEELCRSEIIGREIPFTIPWEGNIMEGVIDLVYRKDGGVVVADYKTDRAEESQLKKHAERYALQRDVYLEAVRQGLGVDDPKFKLIFLRLGRAI